MGRIRAAESTTSPPHSNEVCETWELLSWATKNWGRTCDKCTAPRMCFWAGKVLTGSRGRDKFALCPSLGAHVHPYLQISRKTEKCREQALMSLC